MVTRGVDRVLVGVLVAVAAVAGASHWAGMASSTWSDEVATATLAERPLSEMVRVFAQADGGFAGYLVLMNGWTSVFGASETVLRIPSASAALVAVVLAGLLAARIGGRVAGVATGVLVAVHPFLLPQYFAEARPYALVAASVTGAALAAHILRDEDRTVVAVAWSLAATLAISLHVLAVLALVPQLLWLFGRRSRHEVGRLAPVLAPPAAMALVMAFLTARATSLQEWIPQVSVRTPRDAAQAVFSAGGVYLLVGALIAIVVVEGHRRARAMVTAQASDLMVLGLWILLPVAILVIGSIAWTPMFLGRYVVSSTVAAMILLGVVTARALESIRVGAAETRGRIGGLVLGVSLMVSVVSVGGDGALRAVESPEDLPAATAWIQERQQPGDLVLYRPTWAEASLRWHFDRGGGGPSDVLAADISAQEAGSLYTPTVGVDEALARLDGEERLFVAGYYDDGGTPLGGTVEVAEEVVEHLLRCWTVVDRADYGLVVEMWELDTGIDGCGAA